mgnify:CR=1 FL=1
MKFVLSLVLASIALIGTGAQASTVPDPATIYEYDIRLRVTSYGWHDVTWDYIDDQGDYQRRHFDVLDSTEERWSLPRGLDLNVGDEINFRFIGSNIKAENFYPFPAHGGNVALCGFGTHDCQNQFRWYTHANLNSFSLTRYDTGVVWGATSVGSVVTQWTGDYWNTFSGDNFHFDYRYEEMKFEVISSNVSSKLVLSTPLPAPVFLLSGAFIGLGVLGRRYRRRHA